MKQILKILYTCWDKLFPKYEDTSVVEIKVSEPDKIEEIKTPMGRIPKILHMYWDRSPMSWLQTLTVSTFHHYNPEWVINIYVPKQRYNGVTTYIPNYVGKDYFSEIEQSDYVNIINIDLHDYNIDTSLHNILRSDILRYHLLYDQGGVWSDFDVLWLKPIEHFKNISYYGDTPSDEITSVVSFINDTSGGHSIGVMISCQHDLYAKSLIELSNEIKPPYGHETFGSLMISAKYPTLESLSGFKGLIGVKHSTYYPYNIHPPNDTFNKLYLGNDLCFITNDTICLHWYNGKQLSKDYVNFERYKIDCSMTTILRNEGYIK